MQRKGTKLPQPPSRPHSHGGARREAAARPAPRLTSGPAGPAPEPEPEPGPAYTSESPQPASEPAALSLWLEASPIPSKPSMPFLPN